MSFYLAYKLFRKKETALIEKIEASESEEDEKDEDESEVDENEEDGE